MCCGICAAVIEHNTALLDIKIPIPSLEKQDIIASYLTELAEYNVIIDREKEIVSKISASILDALVRGE